MTLIGFLKEESFNIYSGEERIKIVGKKYFNSYPLFAMERFHFEKFIYHLIQRYEGFTVLKIP